MALFEQVKEVIVRELSVPESWVTKAALETRTLITPLIDGLG